MRRASLPKLTGIGATYADAVQAWQQGACFGPNARLAGDMVSPVRGQKVTTLRSVSPDCRAS